MSETDLVTTDDQAPGQSTREFSREDLALIDHLSKDGGSSGDTQAVAILPAEDVERDLKDLAALRRENPTAYWKEPTQQRERELIEMRDQWNDADREGKAASVQVERILGELPESEAADFESGFETMWEELPAAAQAVIRHELATKADPVRPASQAAIERFASTPEGAELVKSWRGKAGIRLAALQERTDRLTEAGDDVAEWFDGLPPQQAKALLQALAG